MIPQWKEVLDFTRRAACHNKDARFIGWDVAITADGCEMIEGQLLCILRFDTDIRQSRKI